MNIINLRNEYIQEERKARSLMILNCLDYQYQEAKDTGLDESLVNTLKSAAILIRELTQEQ